MYCDAIRGMGMISPDIWSPYLSCIEMLSCGALLFVAYTIFYTDHLRKHPAEIIGYISFFYAFFNGMAFSTWYLCPLNGETIFAATVYRNTTEPYLLKAMNTLQYSWFFFAAVSSFLPTNLETCLVIDLVLTIQRPMER